MKGFLCVFGFLTRLPVPGGGGDVADLAAGAPWFPLAGALVGGVAAAAALASAWLWPAPLPAAAALAAGLWASGGLHLDGLMDVADGLGSNLPPGRVQTVLHDSRVGAVGALAGALALILRFALYDVVAWPAIVAAAAVARWSMVLAGRAWGREGTGGGLGATFAAGLGARSWIGSLLLAAALAGALSGLRGLASLGAATLVTALLAPYLRRRLGGLSGDALGAVAEVAEWAALAVFAARLPRL